jgi:hypothetical protein
VKIALIACSKSKAKDYCQARDLYTGQLFVKSLAYAGLWSWPPPDPIPSDLVDVEQRMELKARYHQAQLELFGEGEIRLYGNVPVRLEAT